MKDYSRQNKTAWEYNAYDFWVRTAGKPADRAKKNLENPIGMLRRYANYFDRYDQVKVANICGSCGKKAIPLALLGAEVTIFDISEENKRYALEVAEAAHVSIGFEVCDILEIDMAMKEKWPTPAFSRKRFEAKCRNAATENTPSVRSSIQLSKMAFA